MAYSTKISFANIHFFVGLDAHLRNWKVNHPVSTGWNWNFLYEPSPWSWSPISKNTIPWCIYHIVTKPALRFWALRIFRQHNIDCIIVNPRCPYPNKEKVNKSDPIDSRNLPVNMKNKSLHGIYIPDTFHEELRALMRLRYRIIQSQTRIKNRIKGLLYCQETNSSAVLRQRSMVSQLYSLASTTADENSAGNFTLQSLILQLKEIREHNKMFSNNFAKKLNTRTLLLL